MSNEQKRKYEILLKLIENEKNDVERALLTAQAAAISNEKGKK